MLRLPQHRDQHARSVRSFSRSISGSAKAVLTSTGSGDTFVSLQGDMRKRSALGLAILIGLLVLAIALPARAGPRLRLYRGTTSQVQRITFVVAKTDAGRFIRSFDARLTFTCDDETTQDIRWSFGFSNRQVPIIDGAFTTDQVDQTEALHLAGQMGSLHGEGTLTLSFPAFTPDEQAEVCTTGALTWTAEFVRRL